MDASILAAPSSRKNQKGEGDVEMKQSKKGNQWCFGRKLHIGVDDPTGLSHSLESTAANVHDLIPSAPLLHGEEGRIWRDARYEGMEERQARETAKLPGPLPWGQTEAGSWPESNWRS